MRNILCGRVAGAVGLALLLLAVPACGEKRTPVYKTSGKLLVGGKAYPGVVVILHPTEAGDKAIRPSGSTDADGSFVLTSSAAYDGGPAGDYVVTVIYEPVTSPLNRASRGPAPKIDPLYAKPETSPLRATIQAVASNELPTFELP
jgi:hypothetical protein